VSGCCLEKVAKLGALLVQCIVIASGVNYAQCCYEKMMLLQQVATPYSYLSTPETHLRMRNLHAAVVKQSREFGTIRKRLERHFSTSGVRIEGDTQNGIIELLKLYKSEAVDSKNKEEESFKSIFWSQQILNASQTNKKQIRWHPLIIRWALYLPFQWSLRNFKGFGSYQSS